MLGGLFSEDQQQRQSFAGRGSISPEAMMHSNQSMLGAFGNALAERASAPVSVPSAFAQTPGAYTGGGLPMPIGVVAQDPALFNKALLSRGGTEGLADIFAGLNLGSAGGFPTAPNYGGTPTGPGGTVGGVGPGEIPKINFEDPDGPLGGDYGLDPGAFDNFWQPGFSQNGTTDGGEPNGRNHAERRGPRRRSDAVDDDGEYGELVRASDLIAQDTGGDDLTQGMGAVELFLESLRV